jgi:hypothetical protein
VVLGSLLLLGSLLAYLQTRHAFRHVIVPIVSALAPGELRVRDGVLAWTGTGEMEGLAYENSDAGATFEAERLFIALSLRSLLTGGLPVIRDLTLHQSTVTLDMTLKQTAPGEPAPAKPGKAPWLIPVAVERGLIQGLTLTVKTPSGTATAKDATIKLADLCPGKTGTLQLETAVALERRADQTAWDGSTTFTLTLEQNLESTQATWTGTNAVRVQERSRRPAAIKLLVDQTLSGSYDHATQNLRAATTLKARIGEAAMAPATLDLSLASEGGAGPTTAVLTVKNLSADALNVWLGEQSAVRFDSALIEGRAQMKTEGDRHTFQSRLHGTRVALRMEAQRQRTPPLDVTVQQAGSFDRGTGDLSIETLSLAVSDGARTLLTGALDRPLATNLARTKSGRSEMPAHAAAWTSTLDKVGVQELRPWAALLGGDALAGIGAGELNGAATITIGARARTAELSGFLRATNVMLEGGPQEGGVGPVALDTRVRATLTDLSLFNLDSWTTTVALKGKGVAHLQATGSFRVTPPVEIVAGEGTLSLDGLPAQTLNPLLTRWGPTRVQHALISGKSTFTVQQARIAWAVDLRGREASLRLATARHATPPLNLLLTQTGSLDRTSRLLHLDALRMQILKGSRPVIDASLDKALVLPLDLMRTGAGMGGAEPTVLLTLDIHEIALQQLQPWLAMIGSQAWESVAGGRLDGRLQLGIRDNAETVDVAGSLDLAELQIDGARASAGRPVSLTTRLKATIAQAARVTLEAWTAEITSGPNSIARAKLSGSADTAAGAVDLVLKLESDDLSGSLDRLGWLTESQRAMIEGGQMKGDLRVMSTGRSRPVTITADVRSQNLRVKAGERQMGTHAIVAQGMIEMDGGRTEARLQQMAVTLDTDGVRTGTLSATGHWPIESPATGSAAKAARIPPGELTITAKNWDGAPLADFIGLFPGRAPGPLPITMDLTFGLDPVTGTLTAHGREQVGPLRLAGEAKAGTPTTLRLEHDLQRRGAEFRGARIILTAQRPQGPADKVSLSGAVRFGKRPGAQVRGVVESLDAGWYVDLLSSPSGQAPSPDATRPADTQAGKRRGLGIPPDLDVEVEIGSVMYRALRIGKGRLVAKGDGSRLRGTLEPTGLAGGTVDGSVTIALVGERPELSWTAQGKGLDLPALQRALQPDQDLHMTGTASFTTSGKGNGQGEVLKHSLDGTAVVDVADGKFVNAPVIDFLAEKSGIHEFKGLHFRSIHGDLHLKDGWVHLAQVRVDGSWAILTGTGKVGLDGRVDARVLPSVKASLIPKGKNPCLTSLLTLGDGYASLPLVVVVKGTTEKPQLSVDHAARELFPKATGGLSAKLGDVLAGCIGSSKSQEKLSDQPSESHKGTAKQLLEDFLGGRSRKDRSGR